MSGDIRCEKRCGDSINSNTYQMFFLWLCRVKVSWSSITLCASCWSSGKSIFTSLFPPGLIRLAVKRRLRTYGKGKKPKRWRGAQVPRLLTCPSFGELYHALLCLGVNIFASTPVYSYIASWDILIWPDICFASTSLKEPNKERSSNEQKWRNKPSAEDTSISAIRSPWSCRFSCFGWFEGDACTCRFETQLVQSDLNKLPYRLFTHPKFWVSKLHVFNILLWETHPQFSLHYFTKSLKFGIIITISQIILPTLRLCSSLGSQIDLLSLILVHGFKTHLE